MIYETDLKRLSEPFPADKVSWRVGSTTADKKKGMALAYIDARDVMERLDEVCGAGNWQDRYEVHGSKTICYLTVRVQLRDGANGEFALVTKADGAGDTDVEAEKGSLSDSFKRAAVKWGIGRYLYGLDSPWVELDTKETNGKVYVKGIAKHELQRLQSLLSDSVPAPQAPKQPKAAVQPASNEGNKLVADALIMAARQSKSIAALKAWWMDEKTQTALKGLPESELIRVREAKAEHHIELEDGVPA